MLAELRPLRSMMNEIAPRRKRLYCGGFDNAPAASLRWRGTGSNSENKTRPAKNPPICACQATLAPSAPIAIDPMPKMRLTPNQTARNPSTRGLRKARDRDSAGTRDAASASPRLNDRKLPCTKAKRIAAAIVPDTDAEAPRSEEHTSELQSRLHLVCR